MATSAEKRRSTMKLREEFYKRQLLCEATGELYRSFRAAHILGALPEADARDLRGGLARQWARGYKVPGFKDGLGRNWRLV